MGMRAFLVVTSLVAFSFGPLAADTLEDNKNIVREFVVIGNTRELDRLGEVVARGFVRHCQATPDVNVRSVDDFRRFMEQDVAAFPDSRVDLLQMIAEGDRVAVWAEYSGTQDGQMGPFPPSGKSMRLDFGAVFRIEDGKIAELWVTWDNLAALAQLGHFPAPENERDAFLDPVNGDSATIQTP